MTIETSESAEPSTHQASAGIAVPFSKEERAAMLASVENMMKGVLRQSKIAKQDREDATQDLRLMLWQATERFRPERGVRWSTYAHVAMSREVRRIEERGELRPIAGLSERQAELIVSDADEGEVANENDDAIFGQLHEAVREQLLAPTLGTLSPGFRRLVEMIILDGLTVSQIAEQLGHPRKTVIVNLQNAIGKITGTKPVRVNAKVYERRPPKPRLRSGRVAKKIVAFGASKTIAEWAVEFGISTRTMASRIKAGWLEREAVHLQASGQNPHEVKNPPPLTLAV